MADFDIPPFIPPDDSDDDLAIEEVAASVAPAPALPPVSLNSPPRKRQRTDSVDMKEERASPALTGPPQRDVDYYMADGSCVLMVENTLFNVRYTTFFL